MIFDNDKVTKLVTVWQETDKPTQALGDIISGCDSLIEVIVSRFDDQYREDLIQESRLRIIDVLDRFDNDKGKLHSYLSSVIYNNCVSYVVACCREYSISDMELPAQIVDVQLTVDDDSIELLLARNKLRFPSLSGDVLDEITKYVYSACIDAVYGKSRGIIRYITSKYKVSRTVATTIYHSTTLYLRQLHFGNCDVDLIADPTEYTLLQDFKDIIGDDTFKVLSVLFSGMYIKFP